MCTTTYVDIEKEKKVQKTKNKTKTEKKQKKQKKYLPDQALGLLMPRAWLLHVTVYIT